MCIASRLAGDWPRAAQLLAFPEVDALGTAQFDVSSANSASEEKYVGCKERGVSCVSDSDPPDGARENASRASPVLNQNTIKNSPDRILETFRDGTTALIGEILRRQYARHLFEKPFQKIPQASAHRVRGGLVGVRGVPALAGRRRESARQAAGRDAAALRGARRRRARVQAPGRARRVARRAQHLPPDGLRRRQGALAPAVAAAAADARRGRARADARARKTRGVETRRRATGRESSNDAYVVRVFLSLSRQHRCSRDRPPTRR